MNLQRTVPAEKIGETYRSWSEGDFSELKTMKKEEPRNLFIIKGSSLSATEESALGSSSASSWYSFSQSLAVQTGVSTFVVPPKKEANGSILYIYEHSIVCNLQLPQKEIEVELPKALFPKNIKYGTPITIKLLDNNGVRMPIVQVRTPSPDQLSAGAEEIKDLMNEL